MKSRVLSIILTPLVLAGCATDKGMLKSFENISSDYTNEGFWKIKQRRTMSINGQLPFANVGDVFHYTPVRGNLSAIGLDWATNKSYELVQTYTNTSTLPEILKIRDKITAVSTEAASLIVAGNELEDASETEAKAKAKLDSSKAEEKDAAKSAYDTATVLKEQKQKAVDAAEKKLKQTTADVTGLIATNNLFVFRWNVMEKGNLKATLTDGAAARMEKEIGGSGFVILAGMRSRTLHVTKADMTNLLSTAKNNHKLGWRLVDWLPGFHGSRIHAVTHLIETQHEAYISEQSLKRAIALTVDASKLKGTGLAKKAALEVAINSLESLANAGVISRPTTHKREVNFGQAGAACECHAEDKPWIPLMAVTTRVSDLGNLFETKKVK